MKVKIGTKIMLSYLLVLGITLVLTIIVSSTVLRIVMKNTELRELKTQGESIAKMLKVESERENIEKLIQRISIIRIDNLTKANLVLLGPDGKIQYRSSEEITKKELTAIFKDKKQTQYVASRTPINSNDGTLMGTVILISETGQIQKTIRNMRIAVLFALSIATIIALLLAFWMQRSITKPLKRLSKEMKSTNIEHCGELTPIKTGDEIEELYSVYMQMQERLKRNMQERRLFFQNTSHELKSPLMSIQGYAEAIKDGVVEGDEVNESLDIIIRKSQSLKKIVEEVIYLSRLENEDLEYQFKKVELVGYLEEWSREAKLMARDHQLELILKEHNEKSLIALLDTEKFNSVMNNLFDNALRYAKKNIVLAVSINEKNIFITITDDGKGISSLEEEKIFERFFKGEKGQSGLGLAIVKVIVEEHHGFISATNNPLGGAQFTIALPRIA